MRHETANFPPSFAPTSLLDYTELSIAKIVSSSSMTFSKVGQPTVTNIDIFYGCVGVDIKSVFYSVTKMYSFHLPSSYFPLSVSP